VKNLIRFLTLSMLYSIITLNAYQHELAVCAIFQNEGRFLKEWIEFNILTGVEHFYLYNNYSTDNYAEVLKPYINAGIVDCIDWPYLYEHEARNQILAEEHCGNSIQGRVQGRAQILAYNHCLDNVRGKVKWLMCIDVDEFLFPVQCDDLREFLKDYEEFGAVCANWVMFGTSYVKKIPTNKLLIETLIMSSSLDHYRNRTIKSIIQPEKVLQMSAHRATRFFSGYFQVTANKECFKGNKTLVCAIDKIRINHYWVGDEQYLYEVKLPRLLARNTDKWTQKQESKSFLKRLDLLNKEKDTVISKYVKQLRNKMFNPNFKSI